MGQGGAGTGRGDDSCSLCSPLLLSKVLLPTFRLCSHVLGTLTPRKPMGSTRLAAQCLPLLLLFIGLSASSKIGCSYLPRWSTHCLLASHMVR